MRRIVIVGAGLAGHRAALALHRGGFDGEVVLVGDEPHQPYDRPRLSKQLLAGGIDPTDTLYDPLPGRVRERLGTGAVSLNPRDQVVTLADGGELGYDGVILATGRRARLWPAWPEMDGLLTLRSLTDVANLRRALTPGARVVIVGASFIGCEVAATLRGLGVENVTLIDVAPFPMPGLGSAAGRRAAQLHASHGVHLRLGTSVAFFEGSDTVESVCLEDGERIVTDVVLIALGALPNTDWLEGSGLRFADGNVLCDEHCMAVGVENVAAAGDMAAYPDPITGQPICIEHWSNARDMGAVAARNLLHGGSGAVFAPVPTFWSDQYDIRIRSAGWLTLADELQIVEEDADRHALLVEARRDGELVGAVAFNRNCTIIDYQRRLGARCAAPRELA